MKALSLLGVVLLPTLASCDQSPAASGGPGHEGRGRYSGIGIYEAGRLWSQVKVDRAAESAGKAGLADDEHVIVVVDSHTGEVRQCGDLSGICVAMNPWARGRSAPPLPVELTKNAADLDAEAQADTASPREAKPAS